MSTIDGIYSLRLVIADFYMEKPIFGLDPCYSELRGKEIKRVPIVRIFGANANGQKSCMHVHGVFPYFYIPYDKRDFETLERGILQIAMHLDKALNISLGQGSSDAQHVFKIQLVKGIPFYGYHRVEHQFLKIYMFNPRFVRRAANLLQSGAILNKNFNPHESHVPYILQFMIDFNLYGMSYLHVPLEVVKFRRSNEDEVLPYANVNPQQLLDLSSARKVSCSTLELDISSNFILNRFQLAAKSNATHTNPGIEAIWHDEQVRRQKLAQSFGADEQKVKAIPILEVPPTQERPNIELAESDVFYRTALESKLSSLEQTLSVDQTLMEQSQVSATHVTLQTSVKEQRRTFNLQKLLVNLVYPEECSQEAQQQLVNASFIQNHLSGSGSGQSFVQLAEQREDSDYLNDTLVDEQLQLLQSQGPMAHDATLREEDLELLDVLQQLEELNENESQIDLDSSLAPLSQQHKNFELTPELLDKQTAAEAAKQPLSEHEDDSSDEETAAGNMHDFSVALDDIDELLLKLTQSQPKSDADKSVKMPQVDGADDQLPRTPKKAKTQRSPPRTPTTPKSRISRQQPRTPKSSAAKKYAPLPLTIVSKSAQKSSTESPVMPIQLSQQLDTVKSNPALTLRKKLAMTELRRKTISAPPEALKESTRAAVTKEQTPLRRSLRNRAQDLDKTHIVCSLTPRQKNPKMSEIFMETKETSASSEEEKKPRRSTRNCSKQEAKEVPSTSKKAVKSKAKAQVETGTELIKGKESGDTQSDHNCLLKVVTSDAPATQRVEAEMEKQSADAEISTNGEKSVTEMESPATSRTEEVILETRSNLDIRKPSVESPVVASEEDETIVSDTESDRLLPKLRKTPNLRRLRRSFRDTLLAKNATPTSTRLASPMAKQNALEIIDSPSRKTAENQTTERETLFSKTPVSRTPLSRTSFRKVLPGDSPTPFETQSSALEVSARTPIPSPTATPTVEPMEVLATPHCSPQSQEDNTPELMRSFYEHSFMINSPSVFSEDLSSPQTNAQQKTVAQPSNNSTKSSFVITPLELPPSYDEVLRGCRKLDYPEYTFQQPFYSNPADVSKMTEVGFLVLRIPGNKLNDLEPFESCVLPSNRGLAAWRRKQLLQIGGPAILQRYKTAGQIREYFSTEKRIVIEPAFSAPSRQDAKLWLKARELHQQRKGHGEREEERNDVDSPIKIKRQKITMMLNEGDGAGADEDGELDCSGISLTPMSVSLTPASSQRHAVSNKMRSRRGTKLQFQASSQDEPQPSSSQSSEQSVASSAALDALERSSFVRQLDSMSGGRNSHELSFGLNQASLDNTFGFKVNLENLQQAKADIECNYLTIMTLEVFVATREDLQPDPMHDEIRCLFYAIEHSLPPATVGETLPSKACGYIIVSDASDLLNEGRHHGLDADIELQVVQSEAQAFEALLALCTRWDADIYAGYEIEMSSWGYVIERAKHLCFNIAPLLSRVPSQKVRDFVDEDREQFTDLDVEMKLCGRILLDVWRLMRSEIALTSYTFENVMYHILHKRCPWHSPRMLSDWFASPCTRWIVLEYYLERVRGTLALLGQLDLLGRTSEMAKLIGIQFYEVLSRGSQFRVESMMLRIAKPKNLVPLSPSVQQRAHMRAPEYLALIMEPESRFYADPLIVLDFQSLYPSMIIGYNYCFSTCLGRVEHLGSSTTFEFGASQLRVSRQLLQQLLERNLVTVSPCGVVFVKREVREGILPRMLSEILDTRQMVKQSMKLHKDSSALQRVLHSRQLGLKLMANVTYGYTAANFSGRMPAVEVGDSVVSKGRETLERAIKLVEMNEKWKVRVVYGDTDSMFVLVPGRNRAEAFRIGEEIAQAVTEMNPHPVKLKLEKVYQPCLLQTKKRYVGYMYETPDQEQPVYEAKGIETVRRDGCPAVAKMLEKVLRLLFETADVSQIKQYVCRQFTKLLSGRANLQDLIFAKEFRGLNGYKPTACVPALELTRKWMQKDPRRVPRRGERVPFCIINGPPGMQLIRLVRHPHEVLAHEGYKINAIYYITKAIIPPLNRCLLLIGADVNEWFSNLPRKLLMTPAMSTAGELMNRGSAKSTISQYFSTTNCIIDCGRQTKAGICSDCARNPSKCVVTLHARLAQLERGYRLTQQICQACCGRLGDLQCGSLDCPVLYVLEVKRRELQQMPHIRQQIEQRF
ncbi:DNA polymerase zeta catalytic subunit [Drosophila albomicans]|uniref:DNA polymerase zeta catalytic subunit n=1 Tax=Drosophila albomicans TaxID=7291 RepID=A0A6P8WGU0_DROAB|nr:DNA polymerase zeta catalytic subunit [Drosophila albomicans]